MLRTRVPLALAILCFVSPVFAKSHVPTKNTRSAIKKFVQDAAKVVSKKGADCAELSSAAWKGGDYYIFVVGPDEKLVCHPTLAGKPASEVVDSNGKHVGTALVEAGKKKGGGWVDYMWPRPGTTNPVAKSSYAMEVKGPDGKMYSVGSGGYELK